MLDYDTIDYLEYVDEVIVLKNLNNGAMMLFSGWLAFIDNLDLIKHGLAAALDGFKQFCVRM